MASRGDLDKYEGKSVKEIFTDLRNRSNAGTAPSHKVVHETRPRGYKGGHR